MGEKVETKNEGEKKAVEIVEKAAVDGGDKKTTDGGENKSGADPITAVLKLELHCEGCAKKVRRSVSHLQGVERVKADCDAKKLAVTGKLDPVWLREQVEIKTKRKVELISPQPKKDDGAAAAASEKKSEDKKPKEAAVSTVVMKIKLHCDGCANKIKRVILKNINGVTSATTNLEKDLVTVIGTMDVKELTTYLKEKLKRNIEIIPPKKVDGGGGGGGEKKETDGGGKTGEEKKEKESGGGENKKEVEPKSDGGASGGEGTKVEVNKMEHHGHNPQTHYAMPMGMAMYNQDYGMPMYHHDHDHHHHQGYPHTGYVVQYSQGPPPPPPTYLNMNDHMFSDENPNGCFVM